MSSLVYHLTLYASEQIGKIIYMIQLSCQIIITPLLTLKDT